MAMTTPTASPILSPANVQLEPSPLELDQSKEEPVKGENSNRPPLPPPSSMNQRASALLKFRELTQAALPTVTETCRSVDGSEKPVTGKYDEKANRLFVEIDGKSVVMKPIDQNGEQLIFGEESLYHTCILPGSSTEQMLPGTLSQSDKVFTVTVDGTQYRLHAKVDETGKARYVEGGVDGGGWKEFDRILAGAEEGDLEKVKYWMQRVDDWHKEGYEEGNRTFLRTALQAARENRHTSVEDFLVHCAKQIYTPGILYTLGIGELEDAASRGDLEEVKRFLEDNLEKEWQTHDLATADKVGTAIKFAVAKGHLEVANFISKEFTERKFELREGHYRPFLSGIKANAHRISTSSDEEKHATLLHAAREGDLHTVKWLVEMGVVDPTKKGADNKTACQIAKEQNHHQERYQIIKFLETAQPHPPQLALSSDPSDRPFGLSLFGLADEANTTPITDQTTSTSSSSSVTSPQQRSITSLAKQPVLSSATSSSSSSQPIVQQSSPPNPKARSIGGSSTTPSLHARALDILYFDQQKKILKQLENLRNPPDEGCIDTWKYYGFVREQTKALLRRLEGNADGQGSAPGGESLLKPAETIAAAALNLMEQVVVGAILPVVVMPLEKLQEKVEQYKANKETNKLLPVLGSETSSIDELADTMARMMADMCRGQKRSTLSRWQEFAEKVKGTSFGETKEETQLRLMAAEHLVKVVHQIAEEIQRGKDNNPRPHNDNQAKVRDALKEYRKEYWPDYQPETLENNFVWGQLDVTYTEEALAAALDEAKKQRKQKLLELDKRITSRVVEAEKGMRDALEQTAEPLKKDLEVQGAALGMKDQEISDLRVENNKLREELSLTQGELIETQDKLEEAQENIEKLQMQMEFVLKKFGANPNVLQDEQNSGGSEAVPSTSNNPGKTLSQKQKQSEVTPVSTVSGPIASTSTSTSEIGAQRSVTTETTQRKSTLNTLLSRITRQSSQPIQEQQPRELQREADTEEQIQQELQRKADAEDLTEEPVVASTSASQSRPPSISLEQRLLEEAAATNKNGKNVSSRGSLVTTIFNPSGRSELNTPAGAALSEQARENLAKLEGERFTRHTLSAMLVCFFEEASVSSQRLRKDTSGNWKVVTQFADNSGNREEKVEDVADYLWRKKGIGAWGGAGNYSFGRDLYNCLEKLDISLTTERLNRLIDIGMRLFPEPSARETA